MERRANLLWILRNSCLFVCNQVYKRGNLGANSVSWSAPLFNASLGYVGSSSLVLSVISLIVGVIYLILGEIRK